MPKNNVPDFGTQRMNGGIYMFNKKKRIPAYVFLAAFVALIVAAAIAFLCPIPDKFRQLVFWGLVMLGTVLGALIAALIRRKGMRR